MRGPVRQKKKEKKRKEIYKNPLTMLISLLEFDFIWFIIQMSGLIMLYLIMIDLNCMSPLKTSHPTGDKLVN